MFSISDGDPAINYDEAPVALVQLEGTEFRVDASRGTAVAISARESGTWAWQPQCEGKWDGVRLKAKGVPFPVATELERALKNAARERAELGFG